MHFDEVITVETYAVFYVSDLTGYLHVLQFNFKIFKNRSSSSFKTLKKYICFDQFLKELSFLKCVPNQLVLGYKVPGYKNIFS